MDRREHVDELDDATAEEVELRGPGAGLEQKGQKEHDLRRARCAAVEAAAR